ncbi:phage tail sheath C-terminal domain-containing protein [Roseateles amylovorans]|uniref:Tail sheath protein C-terminal domain-containing protein n=1 Tax=Roseateles amylovorans TaxID=2978473 RepID=A0ABY6B5D0_9BURK|nr:phage tail sheath C-terminal domain-containing protein [Roseateles amylovorans]UXH79160.1 hypothetical protein N4261_04265 [Roseateles amylovorans]
MIATLSPTTRRLPGIRVDVAPPPAVEALPRMDVAVFVGFASTGPLHLPVAIESVAQYAAVFGPDAPLAWDAQRGERITAYLGPAVRAFFGNGGRRCWVQRVARSAALAAASGQDPEAPEVARANTFAMPGLLAIADNGTLAPACAATRCEGAWSDALRLSTAATVGGLAMDGFGPSTVPGAGPNRFSFRSRVMLGVGDLLQIGRRETTCAYAIVEAARVASETGGLQQVEVRVVAAFERVTAAAVSPPAIGLAEVAGFGPPVAATWLGAEAPAAAAAGPLDPPMTRLRFDAPMPTTLEVGHWVRFREGTTTLWQRLDGLQREPALVGSPVSLSSTLMKAESRGPAWRELGAGLPPALAGATQAQRIELALRIGVGAQMSRLSGVGLTPAHPSAFWTLRSDADFYRPRDDLPPAPAADLPRFPLAPLATPAPLAWLPLGVDALFGAPLAPLPQAAGPLERDGLSRFDASLFLDPELADDGAAALVAHADDIRLMRAQPRPLFGLHAALSIGAGGLFNEASLLALPDAVHLGWSPRRDAAPAPSTPVAAAQPISWTRHRGACADQAVLAAAAASRAASGTVATSAPQPSAETGPDFGTFLDCRTRRLNAPWLDGPDAPVPPGSYGLTWSDSEPGATYVLLEALAADFSDAREIYRGTAQAFSVLTDREGVLRYQVFAWLDDERSEGSNPVTVVVRGNDWVQHSPAVAESLHEADWLTIQRAALRLALAGGDLFVALAMPRHFRTAQALRHAARLRAVRQAPAAGDPQAFGFDEARALSYGALYFPWVQSQLRDVGDANQAVPSNANGMTGVRGGPSGLAGNSATVSGLIGASGGGGRMAAGELSARTVPPDGVALGVMAARSSERGAWIAPANQALQDVVALTPPVPGADRQALQEAQVNLLRLDPRGFFALSADTLSLDTELRPINVRRLLTLLRRLALRRGMSWVFEPNGPALRRSVRRGFDTLMNDLFRRGAFAGATPSQSFRVVTDDTVNTAQDGDAGRLIVELRVAPALPMRFITVRLAQSGERLSVVEEL